MTIPTDRWLEMDLTWFDPEADWAQQIDTLLNRVTPLLTGITGDRGIFFNVGWLIDLITEWTGDLNQRIPTRSRRTAQWASRTYGDLTAFITQLRQQAAEYDLPNLRIGVLFVQWAHVVWPPELKIYDFDSDWYERHPELYAPPASFIGMPDLHPQKLLKADQYPYAAFPDGIPDGTYFPDFFGMQWGHFARTIGFDAIHLRDGFTGPMIYSRSGPYGTSAPADPAVVARFSRAVRDLFRAVKQAAPDRLVFGYSSAISPVADWRVGCVDFEALVADGYIDCWVEQTWGGAWQDWWHQLWKGWTFQLANLLTRGTLIAAANQHRAKPCKFYNLIETWDGWEPWDTIHQVPDKLRWATWAFSHAGVLTPDGPRVPDGSYISWMNNGQRELLSHDDIAFIHTHLTAAQTSATQIEAIYGWALVYNRSMMAWLSETHPDWNISEWIDDQAAFLMKWGIPILSASRVEWLPSPGVEPNGLIAQTPGKLQPDEITALLEPDRPLLVVGRADLCDPLVQTALGFTVESGLIPAGFHVCAGGDAPPYDRPYLPEHASLQLSDHAISHYASRHTPLIVQHGGRLYWQPPDWSEPFNQFLPKYQIGSTYPHYAVAQLLHHLAREHRLSYVEVSDRPETVAFHLWRSAGTVYVLLGNLETGELGDSRRGRVVTLHLSRSQLGLTLGAYRLQSVSEGKVEAVAPSSADDHWIMITIPLQPEGMFVGRLVSIDE